MERTNNNTEREIDLSILLSRAFDSVKRGLGLFFNTIISIFSYLFLFGFKKYIILGLSLLLGIVFGVVKNLSSEEVFESDMILQSNEVPNEDMISKINELGIYADEGNYEMLSEKLDLDTAITIQIKSIGAYWFIDEDRDGIADEVDYKKNFNALKDTTARRIKNLLDVRAQVTHPGTFEYLQEGLLTFLKSDHRLVLMNNNRKLSLQLKIDRIEAELAKLDSLQKYEYFDKEKEMSLDLGNLGSLKVLGEDKDTRLLHNEIIALEDTKLNYERMLNVSGDMVSVVSDFPVSVKPAISLSYEGLYYGLFLMLVVYIILFASAHRQVVLHFFEERS